MFLLQFNFIVRWKPSSTVNVHSLPSLEYAFENALLYFLKNIGNIDEFCTRISLCFEVGERKELEYLSSFNQWTLEQSVYDPLGCLPSPIYLPFTICFFCLISFLNN